MKLIKRAEGGLSQDKDVPGLLSCHIDYEIKSGSGRLDYTGPEFQPPMWHQVMSFFRWTNKEMDSESQVRLYVNLKLGCWSAWAFPQEARTGMSAREIVSQESPEQAVERFASWGAEPSGDWVYFCTVHHHCAASAFQSGTDEENERGQDGLHITVGRMDADQHDLHARFYLDGHCFEPDMSRFWEVEPELAQQVPPELLDDVARFQMCRRVVVDFPDAWRKNVIEIPAYDYPRGRQPLSRPDDGFFPRQPDLPYWIRAKAALREITDHCAASGLQEDDLVEALHATVGDPAVVLIVEACLKHQLEPEDLLAESQAYDPGF